MSCVNDDSAAKQSTARVNVTESELSNIADKCTPVTKKKKQVQNNETRCFSTRHIECQQKKVYFPESCAREIEKHDELVIESKGPEQLKGSASEGSVGFSTTAYNSKHNVRQGNQDSKIPSESFETPPSKSDCEYMKDKCMYPATIIRCQCIRHTVYCCSAREIVLTCTFCYSADTASNKDSALQNIGKEEKSTLYNPLAELIGCHARVEEKCNYISQLSSVLEMRELNPVNRRFKVAFPKFQQRNYHSICLDVKTAIQSSHLSNYNSLAVSVPVVEAEIASSHQRAVLLKSPSYQSSDEFDYSLPFLMRAPDELVTNKLAITNCFSVQHLNAFYSIESTREELHGTYTSIWNTLKPFDDHARTFRHCQGPVTASEDMDNNDPPQPNNQAPSSSSARIQQFAEASLASANPLVVAPASSSERESVAMGPSTSSRSSVNLTNDRRQGYGEETGKRDRFRAFQEKKWEELYQRLLAFRSSNGHCNVPITYDNDPSLARWVKRQRYQYSLTLEGSEQATLTQERIDLLNQVDFTWDPQSEAWDRNFQGLEDFHNKHGHVNVPMAYSDHPSLGNWVKSQRRQYKLFHMGKPSFMLPERIARLESIGFQWEVRKLKSQQQEKKMQQGPQGQQP